MLHAHVGVDYVVVMEADDGEISVHVSVPRHDGGHVLSEKEREILAAEHAQNLALHLAECLINWRGETPGVHVRRS